jgi:transposase
MARSNLNETAAVGRAGGPLPPIAAWLPDEVLFSLASRHHVLACHVRARDTCLELFGHPQRGSAHDLPSRIDEFVSRTGGALGDAETIIRERTVLPFYLALQAPIAAANAIAAMRGDRIGPLKATLGLLASGFGARHVLKACPACMEVDGAHGTPYWHRSHQIPGVWVCLAHEEPLLVCNVKATGVGRFLWFLPGPHVLCDPGVEIATSDMGIWRGLAECAVGLVNLPAGFHFEPLRLARAHRAAAVQRGWLLPSNRLRLVPMSSCLLETMTVLRRAPDLAALPGDERIVAAQFARLLNESRATNQPIRHCVLALSLHGGWDAFMAAYEATANESVPSCASLPQQQSCAHPRDPRREPLLSLVTDRGLSATAAARQAGVTVATAMAWLCQSGHRVAPRAKVLKLPTRRRAILALRQGTPKADVAAAVGVSVETVTRLLRTEPQLRLQWREAMLARVRDAARSEWLDLLQRQPTATVTQARRSAPAAFAWLYRNDRAWLDGQASQCAQAVRSNYACVDWDRRDGSLSRAILGAGLTIWRERQGGRVTVGTVCQHVPALKPLVNKLDRLPLTRVALDQVIHRRPVDATQSRLF